MKKSEKVKMGKKKSGVNILSIFPISIVIGGDKRKYGFTWLVVYESS